MADGGRANFWSPQNLHPFVRDHASHPVWTRAERYLNHADLDRAVLRYCRLVTAEPPVGWPSNKIFAQTSRYTTCFTLVALDARYRAGEGPAPNLKMLQASVPSSPRQVSSLISGLRAGGYIRVETNARDLRSIHLRPSASLVQAVARSPVAFLEAADSLEIENILSSLTNSVEVVADCMAHAEMTYSARDVFFRPFRDVVSFAERDCGYSLLCAILGRHLADRGGEPWDLPLSYDALAKRFGVSRQHIGNLLTGAADHGLIDIRHGQISRIEATLVWQFMSWCAGQMALYRCSAERVLAKSQEIA